MKRGSFRPRRGPSLGPETPRGADTSRRSAAERPAAALPRPVSVPAVALVVLACAASIVLSSAYRFHDTDLWQLLVVGKAIWTRHAIPTTDQWTWIGFGDPQITSSWGFRALIWPVWAALGVGGLFL